MAEHTRNAGIECLLRAFIAPEQRSGEAPRNKDELRYLIAGVFSWFYEGAVPKKGREAHIITKVLEHVAAELNTAQPPAPPTPPRRRGASAATPATESTADAAEQGGRRRRSRPSAASGAWVTTSPSAVAARHCSTQRRTPQPSPLL